MSLNKPVINADGVHMCIKNSIYSYVRLNTCAQVCNSLQNHACLVYKFDTEF